MNVASAVFSNSMPDSAAFTRIDAAALTYGELEQGVRNVVIQLSLMGFETQDRIALTVPRGPLGLIYFLAISSLAVCCPLDPRLKDDEIESALVALSARALVDATEEKRLDALAERRGVLLIRPLLERAGAEGQFDKQAGASPLGLTAAEDVALLLQTSGTTSAPKLVPLTHANILAAARSITSAYKIGAGDLCLNPMPHYHVHGLISAGLSSLVAGAAQYCAASFSAGAFETAFNTLQPTWFTGSPAFHLGLLDHFKFTCTQPVKARLRFIRSSSAPFPAPMIGPYEDLFGVPLLENYGMTETASTICSNLPPPRQRKPGSVGKPLPGTSIRIVDGYGHEEGLGQEGEIAVQGPSVIGSYAGEIGNAGGFWGSWFRTGDIGRLDEDGYLFAILAYPAVAEALTFSIKHPTLGEELVAILVPRPQMNIDLGALREFLGGRLSTYKIPNAFYCVPEIPKNDTGKAVRRNMAAKLEWLHAPASDPPASAIELLLLQCWQEMLSRTDIGVTDNVFVFGGDTLRAQRVCDQAQAKTGVKLQVKNMLRNPTVREQAVVISSPPTPSEIGK
jgi:oxalate---CoA ligase